VSSINKKTNSLKKTPKFSNFHKGLIIVNVVACVMYVCLFYGLTKNNDYHKFVTYLPIISVAACILNVFCNIYQAKKSLWCFLYAISSVILFTVVSMFTLNYGFALLNVYYVAMNIAGFFMWKKRMDGNKVVTRSLKNKHVLGIVGLDLIVAVGITFLFSIGSIYRFFNGSDIGSKDYLFWIKLALNGASLAICVTAMVLVSFAEKHQWGFWIVGHTCTVLLWLINVVVFVKEGDTQNICTSSFMLFTYASNLTIASYTFNKWKKNIEV